MKEVNIMLATDDNFAQYTSVAMISILKNTNSNLSFYIFGNLSKKTKMNLKTIKNYKKCNIQFREVPYELVAPFTVVKTHKHLNIATYYRLVAYKLLPHLDKIIYFDSDAIAIADIALLDKIEIGNNLFAGVEDINQGLKDNLNIPAEYKYINAGINIMNLKKHRELDILESCYEYAKLNSEKMFAADQDIINGLFHTKIQYISYRFNIFHEFHVLKQYFNPSDIIDYEDSIKNPVIIHFVGPNKPWLFHSIHPYKDTFWDYAKLSPFYLKMRGLEYDNIIIAYILLFKYFLLSLFYFAKRKHYRIKKRKLLKQIANIKEQI